MSPARPAVIAAPVSQEEAQSESIEPPPANTAPAMGSLSDIWAKIVAQLQPFGTKVLMRQQATLLTCDGVEATVGIRSQPLMKMAQDRLSNVEVAFEKVFGHKIRVTMVVAAAEAEAAETPSVPPPAVPSPPPLPPSQTGAVDEISKPLPIEEPSTRSAPEPTVLTNGGADLAAAPPAWESESELERSVKSFAQFFSGQIVNLDDEVSDSAKPSTEPGPDVPF